MEQQAKQLATRMEPSVRLRVPKMFNLRRDLFEHPGEDSNTCRDWPFFHAYLIYFMQKVV
jgi:arylsulfatase